VIIKDLDYLRRRHLSVPALREAIAVVANGTLAARNPAIWGHGTNACASDSRHFAMHQSAAEIAVVIRSRLDDRGRAAPLHRDGSCKSRSNNPSLKRPNCLAAPEHSCGK
jgi:hypothetical protein